MSPRQKTEFPAHNSVLVQMENNQIQNDQRKILRQDPVLLFNCRTFDKYKITIEHTIRAYFPRTPLKRQVLPWRGVLRTILQSCRVA